MTEEPTCDVCGGPATPGGLPGEPEIDTVCPNCEDLHRSNRRQPPWPPTCSGAPPHGNTTR